MLRHLATAMALVLSVSTAVADDAPNPPPTEGVGALAGQFVFNQADGRSRGCVVILDDTGSYGQYDTKLGDDCVEQFEFLDLLTGWEPSGEGFKLIGAEGSLLMEMQPDANGIYRGVNTFDNREYYLERTSG